MGERPVIVVSTVTCFLGSVILSIVALSTPAWIVQDFQGFCFDLFPPHEMKVAFEACFFVATFQRLISIDFSGISQYGLFSECTQSLYMSQSLSSCHAPRTSRTEWKCAAGLLISSIFFIAVATVYAAMSYVKTKYLSYSKWVAFMGGLTFFFLFRNLIFPAAALHSLSSLIFPLGFDGDPIGGRVRACTALNL